MKRWRAKLATKPRKEPRSSMPASAKWTSWRSNPESTRLVGRSVEGPATGWGVSETGTAPIDKSETVAAVADVVGCCCGWGLATSCELGSAGNGKTVLLLSNDMSVLLKCFSMRVKTCPTTSYKPSRFQSPHQSDLSAEKQSTYQTTGR